jgi:hypothetical protein
LRTRADLASGIVLLAFGIFVIVASRRIAYNNLIGNDPLSPATVPTALGVLLTVLSAALIARALLRSRAPATTEESTSDSPPAGQRVRVAVAVGACLGYALLLPRLGFLIVTPLLVAALLVVAAGRAHPVRTVAIAILLPVACYLLFIEALDLNLPVLPGGGVLP